MYNIYKKTILYLILPLLLVVLAGTVCYAATPPQEDTYAPCAVYVNNIKTGDKAYTVKGNIYITIETLQKYGQTDFMTFDTAHNKIFFDAADINVSLGSQETTNFIKKNAGSVYLPIKYFETYTGEGKRNYVSLGSASQLCKIAYRYENGKVFLYPYKDAAHLWTAKSSASAVSIKDASIGSELTLSTGENVTVTAETTSFYKVMDLTGNEYYVNKADFNQSDGKSVPNILHSSRAKDVFKSQINLVWMTTVLSKKAWLETTTELAPKSSGGLDVISPIWMRQTIDGEGAVTNICEYGFVELCHANGIKVWACINNNFDDYIEKTENKTKVKLWGSTYSNTVLNDTAMRNKAIAQYLLYAVIYDLDGINIDFESMDKSVIKGSFNTFVADMNKYCSDLGITLSVATMLASDYWSQYYNFAYLGRNCDYVCPMTYNEHWDKSTGAGSTMSINYFTANTNALISQVPKEKILMGVPFFTQSWLMKSEDSPNDDSSEVKDMAAIYMKTALQRVANAKATPVWDSTVGQYVVQYTDKDGIHRIWLEEERSMAQKLKYVMDSGIAGTACWVYGQQTEDFLSLFDKIYKQGADPLSIEGAWPDAADAGSSDTQTEGPADTPSEGPADQPAQN